MENLPWLVALILMWVALVIIAARIRSLERTRNRWQEAAEMWQDEMRKMHEEVMRVAKEKKP